MVLELAKLTVVDTNKQPVSTPPPVTVQFNPQSLSVNYRMSGAIGTENASTGTNKMGNKAQPTGFSSGLSMELLFDTSQAGEDVRKQTLAIAAMLQLPNQSSAPTVQFSWGTFVFTGVIQSMDETLDLFSERGVPLRATIRLSMSGTDLEQQNPDTASGAGIGFSASASFSAGASASAGFSAQASINAGIGVGTTPLTLAQAGDTLQSLTGRAGISGSWKGVASANNIDNPRQVDPGTVLNLNIS